MGGSDTEMYSSQVFGDALGWGLVVRGRSPCYVQAVDPSSPAATAGVKVGQTHKHTHIKQTKCTCTVSYCVCVFLFSFDCLTCAGSSVCLPGEWTQRSPSGLQSIEETGDDGTSHHRTRSDAAH